MLHTNTFKSCHTICILMRCFTQKFSLTNNVEIYIQKASNSNKKFNLVCNVYKMKSLFQPRGQTSVTLCETIHGALVKVVRVLPPPILFISFLDTPNNPLQLVLFHTELTGFYDYTKGIIHKLLLTTPFTLYVIWQFSAKIHVYWHVRI